MPGCFELKGEAVGHLAREIEITLPSALPASFKRTEKEKEENI